MGKSYALAAAKRRKNAAHGEAVPAPVAWADGDDDVPGLFPLGLLVFWVVRVRFGKKIGDIEKQGFPGRSPSALPRI